LHELSLANEVIRIAGYEAKRNNADLISEITIEAGSFCGVESEIFRSSLEMLSEGTILAGALLNIERKKGKGYCRNCRLEFEMNNRTDGCPLCCALPAEIRSGYEFRVVSIVVEKH